MKARQLETVSKGFLLKGDLGNTPRSCRELRKRHQPLARLVPLLCPAGFCLEAYCQKTVFLLSRFWVDFSPVSLISLINLTRILCVPKLLVTQMEKNLPAMQETWAWSLGWEDPLEEDMANHSSILAWRIQWTENPGGLSSIGLQRVRHDWGNLIHMPISLFNIIFTQDVCVCSVTQLG